MNKPPAFQFYPEEWLSSDDIKAMSREQELGYLRLLMHQWDTDGCRLKDDPVALARMARMTAAEWKKWSPGILVKFVSRKGKLFNKKLLCIYCDLVRYKSQCKAAGSEGARKRWSDKEKRDSHPIATPIAPPIGSDSSPSPIPFPSPLQQQHNRTTDKQIDGNHGDNGNGTLAPAAADRQPDGPLDRVDLTRSAEILQDVGISRTLAMNNAGCYPLRRIAEVVKASSGKRNRAGWVLSALDKQFVAPPLTEEFERSLLADMQAQAPSDEPIQGVREKYPRLEGVDDDQWFARVAKIVQPVQEPDTTPTITGPPPSPDEPPF